MGWSRGKFGIITMLFQVVFIVLFGVFVKYGQKDADASYKGVSLDVSKGGLDPNKNSVKDYYPMFQDVHVMIFVGFGFLMTFLKRYVYGAVGLNMLVAAFVIQWATLIGGFMHMHGSHIEINITTMLTADFAAAAVLISFGAMLGKLSPLQQIMMAFLEIVIFQVNEWIGVSVLQAVDVGGSMFVHVFGAYFGIALGRVLWSKEIEKASEKEGSEYHSDTFAMIGTIFLWLFWPSFNSAVAAAGDNQHRAVLNTYFALAACCVVAFAVSSILDSENKFDMVHVQNATLAGGVAVGTSADMMVQPFGALLIGVAAGIVSVIGYRYVSPFLCKKLHIHDTCGVNNLHGMPGLLAGITGIIVTALATEDLYGASLYTLFPARAPVENSTMLATLQESFSAVEAGDGRSAASQAGYQALALGVTFVVAIVGGAVTGLILKLSIFDPLEPDQLFDDSDWWGIPDTGFPLVQAKKSPNYDEGDGNEKEMALLAKSEKEEQ